MADNPNIYYADHPHFTVGHVDQWGESGYLFYEDKVYWYDEDRKDQCGSVDSPIEVADFLTKAGNEQIPVETGFLDALPFNSLLYQGFKNSVFVQFNACGKDYTVQIADGSVLTSFDIPLGEIDEHVASFSGVFWDYLKGTGLDIKRRDMMCVGDTDEIWHLILSDGNTREVIKLVNDDFVKASGIKGEWITNK